VQKTFHVPLASRYSNCMVLSVCVEREKFSAQVARSKTALRKLDDRLGELKTDSNAESAR